MFKTKTQDYFRNDTLLLSQFLSTTGPEEYFKGKRQSNRASRILGKLRKKPSQEKHNLRDSGVYSVDSDKDTIFSLQEFPLPPIMPHRPTPIPEAINTFKDKKACPHCRQSITLRTRRPSCPPALASGPTIESNTKLLLAMVQQLKSQLAEEKQSRLKLEKAMYQIERREQLESEKRKWVNDCSMLNDRFPILP